MGVGNTVVINRKYVCINLHLSGTVSRLNNRKKMFTRMCAARHLVSGKSSENLLEIRVDLHISRYRIVAFLCH